MRYRPFGQAGVSVSALMLALDDRSGARGPEVLSALVSILSDNRVGSVVPTDTRAFSSLQNPPSRLRDVARRGSPSWNSARDQPPEPWMRRDTKVRT